MTSGIAGFDLMCFAIDAFDVGFERFSLLNAHVMEPTAQNVKQIAALSASLTLFNDALSRLLVGAAVSSPCSPSSLTL